MSTYEVGVYDAYLALDAQLARPNSDASAVATRMQAKLDADRARADAALARKQRRARVTHLLHFHRIRFLLAAWILPRGLGIASEREIRNILDRSSGK